MYAKYCRGKPKNTRINVESIIPRDQSRYSGRQFSLKWSVDAAWAQSESHQVFLVEMYKLMAKFIGKFKRQRPAEATLGGKLGIALPTSLRTATPRPLVSVMLAKGQVNGTGPEEGLRGLFWRFCF